MDTKLIDRWTEYTQAAKRATFDLHLEGLLAIQKIEALQRTAEDDDTVTLDAVRNILYAEELNSHALIECGVEER